jgi:hypothetical protein
MRGGRAGNAADARHMFSMTTVRKEKDNDGKASDL